MDRYTKKLIKLGKTSKAIVLPRTFLKKCSEYPHNNKVIVEEYSDKLVIKFMEDKNES